MPRKGEYGPEGQEVRHFSFEDLLNAEELVWLPEEYRCLGCGGIGTPMQRLDEAQGELVLGPLPRLEGDEPLGSVRIALGDGRVLNRSAETSLALEDLLGRFRNPRSADERFTVAVLLSRLEAPQLRSLWLELATAAATEERLYWVAMSGLRRLSPEVPVPPVALAGRLGRSEAFDERFLQWVAEEKPTVPAGVWRAMMLNRKAAAWVREQALDLALRDEPDNLPLLLAALGDDTLRRDAIRALDENPLPGALDAVIRLLEHRDPSIRRAADSLLGESYARRAPYAKRLEVEALKPRSPLGRAPRTLKAVVTRAELRADLERARVLATRLLDCARTEAAPVPREDLRVTALARLAEIALAQGRRAELDRLLSLLKGSREDAWGCDPFRLEGCSLTRVSELVEQLFEVAKAPVELQVRLRQGAIELLIRNRASTPLRFPANLHLTVGGWHSGDGCLRFATLFPAPAPSSAPPPPLPASPAEAFEAAGMALQSSCGPSSQLPRFAGLQGCGGPTGFVVKGAVDVDPRRAGSPGGAQRQRAGRRM